MMPNDEWHISDSWHKNEENIQFWTDQSKKTSERVHTKTNIFSYDKLLESFKVMKSKLHTSNDMKNFANKVGKLKPSTIYVSDLDMCVSYDILSDFKRIYAQKEDCDVHMSSESLYNVMKNAWGFGTLMINGRFQANYESFGNFVSQARLYYMNNIGKTFPSSVKAEEITNSSSLVNKLVEAYYE